jgi:hypothetical protein
MDGWFKWIMQRWVMDGWMVKMDLCEDGKWMDEW